LNPGTRRLYPVEERRWRAALVFPAGFPLYAGAIILGWRALVVRESELPAV
jgi:hypothetical protein